MKVKCISQCQTDRVTLYEVGKEYDVSAETYKNNRDKFTAVKKTTK